MFVLIIGIAIGMTILIAIYGYILLRRAFQCFYTGKITWWMNIGLILCAGLLAACCLNPFGKGALVMYHIFGISIVLEVINGFLRLWEKKRNREIKIWKKLYRCGIIPIVLTGIILSYGYMCMMNVKENNYTVTTKKVFQNKDEYKVAFLSDLHFGNTIDIEQLKKHCDAISSENVDFIILGGDIVDERTSKKEMEQTFWALGSMKSKYGIYYVFGNHDSASYSSTPNFTVDNLKENLIKNGIKDLSDQRCKINNDIMLVGRNDRGYGDGFSRMTIEDLLKEKDKKQFILLVDHQPVGLQENAGAGVDLQLSGHTHGGQIWPVGLISDFLGFGEMNYGKKQIGNYQIIVSSGMAGWGYPVRTGHDSEYLIVTIKNERGENK